MHTLTDHFRQSNRGYSSKNLMASIQQNVGMQLRNNQNAYNQLHAAGSCFKARQLFRW